jgi:hypothetical protein
MAQARAGHGPGLLILRDLRKRLTRGLYVIRMEDVKSGSREELRLRVPQQAQERRVHALERAVEADDGQRVDREVEELLQLGLRHIWRPGHVDALLSFPRLSLRTSRGRAGPTQVSGKPFIDVGSGVFRAARECGTVRP